MGKILKRTNCKGILSGKMMRRNPIGVCSGKQKKEMFPGIERKTIPELGEGVYLVEEKYKGENVYVVYIPKANFGYQINEPLYRFLCLCIERKHSMEQITGKIAGEFEVEQEVIEQDLAPWILKFKKMGIIEYDETLPE